VELRHFRYFVAVGECLNFTRAAAKLRLAQPALSRQIRDLEEELGVRLFERSSRFVRLTEAGKAFLSEARAVLDHSEHAANIAKAYGKNERSEIQIGYSPSPTIELLPEALSVFREAAPSVRIKLHDLSSEEILAGLRDGRLDAALTVAARKKRMHGLIFEELRTYPVTVVMPRSGRWLKVRCLGLGILAEESLVCFSRDEYPEYYSWLIDIFRPVRRKPRIGEEVDSASSLIAGVEAGRGIALVPSCFSVVAGSRLKFVPLNPTPAPLVVGICYLKSHLKPGALRFVEIARALRSNGL
jgi:DNA-binding transcriptional LysR family regulator